jgi:phage gp36-like protein
MAEMDYATLQTTASAALGDASTRIASYLSGKQLNADVTQLLTNLKADIDADKTEVDGATEPEA